MQKGDKQVIVARVSLQINYEVRKGIMDVQLTSFQGTQELERIQFTPYDSLQLRCVKARKGTYALVHLTDSRLESWGSGTRVNGLAGARRLALLPKRKERFKTRNKPIAEASSSITYDEKWRISHLLPSKSCES